MEWFPSPALRHGERTRMCSPTIPDRSTVGDQARWISQDGRSAVLKALEFQVGYYTRGYAGSDQMEYFQSVEHRYGYIGIGLNVTYLLDRLTGHRAAGVFDYYQVPYTYVSTREDFN